MYVYVENVLLSKFIKFRDGACISGLAAHFELFLYICIVAAAHKKSYSSLGFVVFDENLPSLLAHKAWWWGLSGLGHSTHARSRDELEVLLDAAWSSKELHG